MILRIQTPANRIAPRHITTSPRPKYGPKVVQGPRNRNRHKGLKQSIAYDDGHGTESGKEIAALTGFGRPGIGQGFDSPA